MYSQSLDASKFSRGLLFSPRTRYLWSFAHSCQCHIQYVQYVILEVCYLWYGLTPGSPTRRASTLALTGPGLYGPYVIVRSPFPLLRLFFICLCMSGLLSTIIPWNSHIATQILDVSVPRCRAINSFGLRRGWRGPKTVQGKGERNRNRPPKMCHMWQHCSSRILAKIIPVADWPTTVFRRYPRSLTDKPNDYKKISKDGALEYHGSHSKERFKFGTALRNYQNLHFQLYIAPTTGSRQASKT